MHTIASKMMNNCEIFNKIYQNDCSFTLHLNQPLTSI